MEIKPKNQPPANDAETEDFGERSVEITVRAKLGTYETSMLCKKRASCTSGHQQAAEALGRKVFGTRFVSATPIKPPIIQEGVTHWRLNYIESAIEGGTVMPAQQNNVADTRSEPTTVEVNVRYSGNRYLTDAINGVKASSTAGGQQAAERFGAKYFGPAYIGARLIKANAPYKPNLWRIDADPKAYAWCWASGLIEVQDAMPTSKQDGSGPVAFASGPRRALQESLCVLARHGQGASKGKLLAPGVPESASQKGGMTALILWVNCCAVRNGSAKQHGVVYARDGDML